MRAGEEYKSLQETENGVVIKRLDKLLKVKGVLVDPIAIENAIRAFNLFGEEYRIIFEKNESMDNIRVQMELKPGIDPSERAQGKKVVWRGVEKKDVAQHRCGIFSNLGHWSGSKRKENG